MTKEEVLKQALAAMRDLCDAADDVGVAHFDSDDMSAEAERMARATLKARDVLRTAESALAAPAAEPVARKPLSIGQIIKLARQCESGACDQSQTTAFARAVERAHGIE